MAVDYVVDFPALFVVPEWIRQHCVVADGFQRGRPFAMYDWQLWCTLNHYRIKEDAEQVPAYLDGDPDAIPVRSAAFYYRRSQIMAPQKTGKGPWSATIVIAEAIGPVLFLDWAKQGDVYRCSDYGCGCGWVYHYEPGEPMGHPWPTPIVQMLATSEDQVDNVYKHVKGMARGIYLRDRLKVREGFVRVINDDTDPDSSRIDVVTSSATSRLGNPVTFALQDETQLYTDTNKMVKTAQTQRRGAAPMGGRTMETTNCYDPSENSIAQRTRESKRPDIFRFYDEPPAKLSYRNRRDRAKIHAYNYRDSPHADLHNIEAEAAELMETDPGQAERFYGNRIVAGLGTWMERDLWVMRKRPDAPNRIADPDGDLPTETASLATWARLLNLWVPERTPIVVGFDGSDIDDWTGFRCETRGQFQFTPRFADGRPMRWDPKDHGGQVPRLEVNAAMDYIMQRWLVVKAYFDPPYWDTEIDAWAEKYGDDRIHKWWTLRPRPMTTANDRLLTDVGKKDSEFTHDGCPDTEDHITAAKTEKRSNGTYKLVKPGDGRKIDLAIPSVLAHEAWGDVTNGELWPVDLPPQRAYVF